jgi:hypothetical protein
LGRNPRYNHPGHGSADSEFGEQTHGLLLVNPLTSMLALIMWQETEVGRTASERSDMAGIIIPILKKQTFDYTFLGTSSSSTLVLHSALKTMPYKSARLLLRVHSVSMTATQTIVFSVTGTHPTILRSSREGRRCP